MLCRRGGIEIEIDVLNGGASSPAAELLLGTVWPWFAVVGVVMLALGTTTSIRLTRWKKWSARLAI